MKRVEAGSGGASAAAKRRRRDAPGSRRNGGGVSVRRRVQVDATTPAPLERLLAECRRAFGGPGTVPAPNDVALIRDILDKMRPEDVHLRAVTKAAAASGLRTHTHPIITRTTIYKCKNFSIVIFLLPPGAVIPLHDHPGMTVFSKLLLGSLHVTSYDWVDPGDGPPAAVGGKDRHKVEPDDVGLMDEFRFSDEMNGAGCQNPPIITCKIIHDCNAFTITVFFLPRAAAMPLHNHPGMTVFSKLLVGSAHVVSYDWVRPRVCAAATGGPEPETMMTTTTMTMLAERVLDDRFTAASGAWALFPDAGGNLHRLMAGEDGPCALLDVITPPYSPASEAHAQQRFAYYQEFPYELHRPSNAADDGELTEEQKRRLAWLQEIGDEPKDLRISNLPYRGPPIA